MLRAFRYRFYPSADQENALRRTIGCTRLVYNKALHERTAAWANEKRRMRYAAQDRELTAWKRLPELQFLNEVSAVPLQQALRHLQTAYEAFFAKRARHPRFKKRHFGGAATYTKAAFRIRNGEIFLAKMNKPLPIRWSRPLPSAPSSVTITLNAAGRWHVSVLCDDPGIDSYPTVTSSVGLDMGLHKLVTTSNGESIENPRHDRRELDRSRKLSRRLSRKKKGSRNREKARLQLARLREQIANRRQDHLHKLSTRLVRENQTIAVEHLNVAGMVRNRSLAGAIADAGWADLIRMLEYKCAWRGRAFIRIDRFFPSSKTCSCCGVVLDHLELGTRLWHCEACGANHERDHNAAKNILAAGLAAVNACGPGVSRPILRDSALLGLKQETRSAS